MAKKAGNGKLARLLEFHIFAVHICMKNWNAVEDFIRKYNPNSGDIVEDAFYVAMVHDLVHHTVIYHNDLPPEERFLLFRKKSEWLLRLFLECFKRGLLHKHTWLSSFLKTIRNDQNMHQDNMNIIKFLAQQCNLFVSSQYFWRLLYFAAPAVFENDSLIPTLTPSSQKVTMFFENLLNLRQELRSPETMSVRRRTQIQLYKYRAFQFLSGMHPMQYFLPEIFKTLYVVQSQESVFSSSGKNQPAGKNFIHQFASKVFGDMDVKEIVKQLTQLAECVQEIINVLKLQMQEHQELYSPYGQDILDFVQAVEKLNFAEKCWLLSETVLEVVDRWQVAQQKGGITQDEFDLAGFIEKVKTMVKLPNRLTHREEVDAPVVERVSKIVKSEPLPRAEVEIKCLDHIELLKQSVVKFTQSAKIMPAPKPKPSTPKAKPRSTFSSFLPWTRKTVEPSVTNQDDEKEIMQKFVKGLSILEFDCSEPEEEEANLMIFKKELDKILHEGSKAQQGTTCVKMFSVLHGIPTGKLGDIDWSEEGLQKLDPLKKYSCAECQPAHLTKFLTEFDALLLSPGYSFNSDDSIPPMDLLRSAKLHLDEWPGEKWYSRRCSACSTSTDGKATDLIQPKERMTKIVEEKKYENEKANLPYHALRNFVWFLIATAFFTHDQRYVFACVPHVLLESYAVDVFEKLNMFLNFSNISQIFSKEFHGLSDVFQHSGLWPLIALSYSLALGVPGLISLATLTAYHLFIVKMFNVGAPKFHSLFVLLVRFSICSILIYASFSWHYIPAFLILGGADLVNIPKYYFKKAYYGGDEITIGGQKVLSQHVDGFNLTMKSLVGFSCLFFFFSQLSSNIALGVSSILFFAWVQLVSCRGVSIRIDKDIFEMVGLRRISIGSYLQRKIHVDSLKCGDQGVDNSFQDLVFGILFMVSFLPCLPFALVSSSLKDSFVDSEDFERMIEGVSNDRRVARTRDIANERFSYQNFEKCNHVSDVFETFELNLHKHLSGIFAEVQMLFKHINAQENVIWRATTAIVLALTFFEVSLFWIFTILFAGTFASAINMNFYGTVPILGNGNFYFCLPMIFAYVFAFFTSVYHGVLLSWRTIFVPISLFMIWSTSGHRKSKNGTPIFGQGGSLFGEDFTRVLFHSVRNVFHSAQGNTSLVGLIGGFKNSHVVTRAAPVRFSIFFLLAAIASQIFNSKTIVEDNTAIIVFRTLSSLFWNFTIQSMFFLISVNLISVTGLSCLPPLVERPRKLEEHEYYLRGSKGEKGYITAINGMQQPDGSFTIEYYMYHTRWRDEDRYLKLAPATNVNSFYDEMVYKLVEWDGDRVPKPLPQLNPGYETRTIAIEGPGVLANDEGIILSKDEYEEWVRMWMENGLEQNVSQEDQGVTNLTWMTNWINPKRENEQDEGAAQGEEKNGASVVAHVAKKREEDRIQEFNARRAKHAQDERMKRVKAKMAKQKEQ